MKQCKTWFSKKMKKVEMMKKRNKTMVLGLLCFLLFLTTTQEVGLYQFLRNVIPFSTVVEAANEEKIQISVNYGLNQHAKYGRYLLVKVTVNNEGNDFRGYLQAYASKVDNNVAYEKEFSVNNQESKEVTITIPVTDNSGYLNIRLLDDKKEVIIKEQYKLKLGNYDKLAYVGILSDDFERLSYLASFGTKVFYLEESDIPEDSLGLDILDILVINHFDTKKLNKGQIASILEWVSSGGTLVLGTGEYAAEVLGGLQDQIGVTFENRNQELTFSFGTDEEGVKELENKIWDYEENRRISLEYIKSQNEALKTYGLEPISVDDANKLWTKDELKQLHVEEVTKAVSSFHIDKGITKEKINQIKLFSTKDYQQGRIEVFHFDLGLEKEKVTTGLAVLTAIRSNLSEKKRNQLDNEIYLSYIGSDLSSYISHSDNKSKPKILYYAIVISGYICLVGPVLFWVLKRVDKKSWYFRIVPVLSFAFLLIIYLMGKETRIEKPYMDYIEVLEYGKENTLHQNLYFSITGNTNRDVNVSLSDSYNVKELALNTPYIYDFSTLRNLDTTSYNSMISYNKENTSISLSGLPAFSSVSFQLALNSHGKNEMSTDLINVGEGLSGKIKNNFPYTIKNAILMSQGYLVSLGDIGPSMEVELKDKYSILICSRDDIYQVDMIKNLMGLNSDSEDDEHNRLAGILEYFMDQNLSNLQDENFIVGIKDDSLVGEMPDSIADSVQEDFLHAYDVYGTEVVKIPVEVNNEKDGEVFISSIDKYLEPNDSYYDKYFQSRYMDTQEVTLKFQFPSDEKITRFTYLKKYNGESLSDYLNRFEGTISFLNVQTGNYDRVFARGENEDIFSTEKYLTDKNELTIKYSTNMSLKSFNILLPHISYWREK